MALDKTQRRADGPIPFDIAIGDPKARIQEYIDRYKDPNYTGFEGLLMRSIRIISAERHNVAQDGMEAKCIFEIQVLPELCNPMGRMHGGAVATLADMSTTMATAPISQKDFWEFGGVSRTLSITYLQPMLRGTSLTVECILRSIGKRLSVTQCSIKDTLSEKLLALAEHGKSALSDQPLQNVRPSQL